VSARLDTYTVCQPGIEQITLEEFARLGIRAKATHGGVLASLTWPQIALANLQLRTATRVLVRVARFDAPSFTDLTRGLRRIDWSEWLAPSATLDVRAASVASRLYHTDAIVERVREVVPDGDGPVQRLSIRIDHDHVIVSLDTSGAPLYQRGWREEAGPAPVRETLAAALVLWSRWDTRSPLIDPCCGSGTIAVEAALWARRVPPGRDRSFAVENWPCAGGIDWERLRTALDGDVRPSGPPVHASDIDPEAVAMAGRNAQRAGVEVVTQVIDVVDRANEPRGPRAGWVVSNPPYGARLKVDARRLYAGIGRLAAPPWHLAVLAAQGAPTAAFGCDWSESLSTHNGGLAVRFLRSGR
jgi:putative N6-adenine-specific DNA methylase